MYFVLLEYGLYKSLENDFSSLFVELVCVFIITVIFHA